MPEASTYLDQLERLKVAVSAATGAPERLLDAQAGGAYAVRDVDDARELLELPEELLRDERVIGASLSERLLRRIAAHSSQGGGYHEIIEKEAYSSGHGWGLSHIQGLRRGEDVRRSVVRSPPVRPFSWCSSALTSSPSK
jgi:hypothetical protein